MHRGPPPLQTSLAPRLAHKLLTAKQSITSQDVLQNYAKGNTGNLLSGSAFRIICIIHIQLCPDNLIPDLPRSNFLKGVWRMRITRHFSGSPEEVWRLAINPHMWPIAPSDFRPESGFRFTSGQFPVLGPTYTGRLDCQVRAAVPNKLMIVNMVLGTWSGTTKRWVFCSELEDAGGGGTLATTTVSGVDPDSEDQRRFLFIFHAVVTWLHDTIESELGQSR